MRQPPHLLPKRHNRVSKTETIILETEDVMAKIVVTEDVTERDKSPQRVKSRGNIDADFEITQDGIDRRVEHTITLTLSNVKGGESITMKLDQNSWLALCETMGKVRVNTGFVYG